MAPKTEEPIEPQSDDEKIIEKPKKPRTPAQIEAFNKAREALKKKIENKQKVKDDEDKVKKIEKLTKRVESIKKEIVKDSDSNQNVKDSDSNDTNTILVKDNNKASGAGKHTNKKIKELSDEESDEEVIVIKKKPKAKKKKIIVVESESSDDEASSNDTIIQKPKPSKPIPIRVPPDVKPKGGISFF